MSADMTNETDDIARTERRELAILLRMQEKGGKITLSDLRKRLGSPSTKNADGQLVPNVFYCRQTAEDVMHRLVQEQVVEASRVTGGSGGSYTLLPASQQELYRLQAKYPDIAEEVQPKSEPKPEPVKDNKSARMRAAKEARDDRAFRRELGPYAQKLFDQERARQREQEQNPDDKGRF